MNTIISICILATGVFFMEAPNHISNSMLPESINGWKIAEDDQIYNNQNLFQYINGGA